MDYSGIKHLHVAFAVLAVLLLFFRGACLLWAKSLLQQRWLRLSPHVVLAALILSGGWLAAKLPPGGAHAWLAAKIAALVVYVALTMFVLRRVPTGGLRLATFVAAAATLAYIIAAAVTKSPLAFLARL